jgi:hypothetical protein
VSRCAAAFGSPAECPFFEHRQPVRARARTV